MCVSHYCVDSSEPLIVLMNTIVGWSDVKNMYASSTQSKIYNSCHEYNCWMVRREKAYMYSSHAVAVKVEALKVAMNTIV